MKIRQVIMRFAVFLAIAFILDQSFGFFWDVMSSDKIRSLLGMRRGAWTAARTGIKEFHESKSNVDMLFLGSSHALASFDPYVFDEALNVNSIILGGLGQDPVTTYYIFKEALELGHMVEFVVIETYWRTLCGEDTNYAVAVRTFHSMKSSRNKVSMLLAAGFPQSLRLLSRAYEKRDSVHARTQLLLDKLLKVKTSEPTVKSSYRGKGFSVNESVVSQIDLINNEFKGKKYTLNPHQLQYLEKIIDLAVEHEAKIVLVSTPVPPTAFKDVQGYQAIYRTIKGIADKHGVEYIDYNILNTDLLIFGDERFRDDDHLNRSGAEILNKHLSQWFIAMYGPRSESPN